MYYYYTMFKRVSFNVNRSRNRETSYTYVDVNNLISSQYFGGIDIPRDLSCKWPTNVSIHFCTVINHFWAFFEKNEKKNSFFVDYFKCKKMRPKCTIPQ